MHGHSFKEPCESKNSPRSLVTVWLEFGPIRMMCFSGWTGQYNVWWFELSKTYCGKMWSVIISCEQNGPCGVGTCVDSYLVRLLSGLTSALTEMFFHCFPSAFLSFWPDRRDRDLDPSLKPEGSDFWNFLWVLWWVCIISTQLYEYHLFKMRIVWILLTIHSDKFWFHITLEQWRQQH